MTKKLKIIPLGGIGEVGKNLTVFEHEGDILLVDCGLTFPEDDMPGVDIVIPDFRYLEKHKSRIRALCITHGHEDHIGAVSFLLRQINCPIYCTRLTAGLLEIKLEEAGLLAKSDIRRVEAGQRIRAGCFGVEFIRVNHSIADSVALAISTPLGMVIHTGDFKVDSTPVTGDMIDLARFGELGKEGVLCMLSDSTNVERPGYAMSESRVGEALLHHFKNSDKRIIVTTFASNVHRIQQIINAAVATGRRVAITGRSMENILRVSIQLGYMDIPPGTIVELSQVKGLAKNKVCIITTGSQGEPMSALHRMAFGAHKQIDLGNGDKVIISASPIPGNEKTVSKLVNELLRRGCEVVYRSLADVHVSGHACEEELKLLLALCKPQYFVPVHGEYRMLKAHKALAVRTGVAARNCVIPELGRPVELSEKGIRLGVEVPCGRVLVDNMNAGDVNNITLRDRQHLSTEGLVMIVVVMGADGLTVVAGPDVVMRGIAHSNQSENLSEDLRRIAAETLENCIDSHYTDWATIKSNLRNALGAHVYRKTKKRPLILPVIMEA